MAVDREEGDETEYDASLPIPEVLPKTVAEVFARRKRRKDSVKHANEMWQPILEHYREYSDQLTFVPWRET